VKGFVERYEAATHTKVWSDIRQERRAELEKVAKMCDLLEKELRFMTVDDGEQYTVPSLAALEHNLEAAMHKVRSEKDRKIGGEMSYLENMV
uniref:K-box domain-containing protein n=1 Tax=Aegilops tauschii subsp. strangulata TaxID=200361 RepID=A0A453FH15_AEGTS